MCHMRTRGFNLYLILLEADSGRGQKSLIPILDGQRQVLVKHLQAPLFTLYSPTHRCVTESLLKHKKTVTG